MRNLSSSFNPRSPRGERRIGAAVTMQSEMFQSTLPTRGATMVGGKKDKSGEFQSTLPTRGATSVVEVDAAGGGVSIHAPHAGSDPTRLTSCGRWAGFNPRSPRGERRSLLRTCGNPSGCFNPRSPRGERRTEARFPSSPMSFNPRSPRGERLPREWES